MILCGIATSKLRLKWMMTNKNRHVISLEINKITANKWSRTMLGMKPKKKRKTRSDCAHFKYGTIWLKIWENKIRMKWKEKVNFGWNIHHNRMLRSSSWDTEVETIKQNNFSSILWLPSNGFRNAGEDAFGLMQMSILRILQRAASLHVSLSTVSFCMNLIV